MRSKKTLRASVGCSAVPAFCACLSCLLSSFSSLCITTSFFSNMPRSVSDTSLSILLALLFFLYVHSCWHNNRSKVERILRKFFFKEEPKTGSETTKLRNTKKTNKPAFLIPSSNRSTRPARCSKTLQSKEKNQVDFLKTLQKLELLLTTNRTIDSRTIAKELATSLHSWRTSFQTSRRNQEAVPCNLVQNKTSWIAIGTINISDPNLARIEIFDSMSTEITRIQGTLSDDTGGRKRSESQRRKQKIRTSSRLWRATCYAKNCWAKSERKQSDKKYRNTYKQAVEFCCQLLRAPSLSSSRNVSTVRNVCSVFHVVVIPCSSFLPLSLSLSLSLAFLCPHRSSFVSSLFTVLSSSSTAGVFFSFNFVM